MPRPLPMRFRPWAMVALAFALSACGSPAPPKPDMSSLEQRLFELERRVESLEVRPVVYPPYRSRAEIESQINALEEERAELLTHYRAEHPEIRDIDRKLAILNSQLKMLE